MKQLHVICVFLILMASSLYNYAQILSESFLKNYNAAKTTSEKGKIILNYLGSDNDSLRSTRLSLLSYFISHEDDAGADYVKLFTSSPAADFSNTLKESFDILERFEKRKDEYGQMWSLETIAASFLLSKNYDEAIRDLSKAIKLRANFPIGYFNRGISFINQKKYDEAIKDFDKAIELKPEDFR